MSNVHLFYLSNHIPWFGRHTGYERLPDSLGGAVPELAPRVFSPGSGLAARAVGKAVSLLRGHGRVSQGDAAARLRLEWALRRDPEAVGHILYGETHLPFWRDVPDSVRRRSVLTVHQPASQWKEGNLEALAACPHVIMLWRREIDWFRGRRKNGEIHFVPHGVDTEFFTPGPAPAGPRRLLYVGIHLRNTEMLARIVPRLDRHDLHFDFLVPARRRSDPGLAQLAGHPRIRWHEKVDDAQLRELYRSAHLLLLPMNDSGANTAVLEALACGLPIVTTDVGGIRDYGGGTVFPRGRKRR